MSVASERRHEEWGVHKGDRRNRAAGLAVETNEQHK